jgi:HEAT repeat protein
VSGCATFNHTQYGSLKTPALIATLQQERIEQLYYPKYPENVKELIVRDGIVLALTRAYDRGGDDLYRFNLIVILNHRSTLSDLERAAIVQCLYHAIKDTSPWVRTEAVFGLGFLGTPRSIPIIIPLLDDQDQNVVNETILTLAKLAGGKDLPVCNQEMPVEERQKAVEFWKEWWHENSSEMPAI